MVIMPVTGNDIGFTQKGWMKLEAALSKKAQSNHPSQWTVDNYFDSLLKLMVSSTKTTEIGSDEQAEVERDFSSAWGGREVFLGVSHEADTVITLEGDVMFPEEASDDEIKAKIIDDFAGEIWEEHYDCQKTVDAISNRMPGSDIEKKTSAVVDSFERKPDNICHIVLSLTVELTSSESASESRSRLDFEREDRMGDD